MVTCYESFCLSTKSVQILCASFGPGDIDKSQVENDLDEELKPFKLAKWLDKQRRNIDRIPTVWGNSNSHMGDAAIHPPRLKKFCDKPVVLQTSGIFWNGVILPVVIILPPRSNQLGSRPAPWLCDPEYQAGRFSSRLIAFYAPSCYSKRELVCMTIRELIKEARKNARFTQRELAEKSGTATGTIQQYERGARQPRLEQFQCIAALGVEWFELASNNQRVQMALYDLEGILDEEHLKRFSPVHQNRTH